MFWKVLNKFLIKTWIIGRSSTSIYSRCISKYLIYLKLNFVINIALISNCLHLIHYHLFWIKCYDSVIIFCFELDNALIYYYISHFILLFIPYTLWAGLLLPSKTSFPFTAYTLYVGSLISLNFPSNLAYCYFGLALSRLIKWSM